MAIISCATDTFKTELLRGIHDFTSDDIKVALYTSNANIGPNTTTYIADNEVVGDGYVAGGKSLAGASLMTAGGVGWVDWNDVSWPDANFSARGALIYNASRSDRAVIVLDFGLNRAFTPSSNTLKFPPSGPNTALLRLGVPR